MGEAKPFLLQKRQNEKRGLENNKQMLLLSSFSLKTKFVEPTLITEADKYHFDLQMTRKKINGKLVETQSPETMLKGKGYHLYMLKIQ